jgi:Holliday junction resolvasome RuvABC endonuclease subunit
MVKISKLTNKPERICAIDASTNSLAFSIFSGNRLTHFGKINFEGINIYSKIKDAARKSVSFFNKFAKDIDAIVIEHTIYMNSPKTQADLALVQGALLGAAAQNKIRLAGSINPIAWQSYIGNGKLTKDTKKLIRVNNPDKSESWYKQHERELRKQKTINFININYDLDIQDNDVADAIGIGHYAVNNWEKIDK